MLCPWQKILFLVFFPKENLQQKWVKRMLWYCFFASVIIWGYWKPPDRNLVTINRYHCSPGSRCYLKGIRAREIESIASFIGGLAWHVFVDISGYGVDSKVVTEFSWFGLRFWTTSPHPLGRWCFSDPAASSVLSDVCPLPSSFSMKIRIDD